MREDCLPNGWRETELGQLGTFFRGRGGTRADDEPNGVPCVRYGDLYTHHECIIRSFVSSISSASASSYTYLQPGDVVFAGSGETVEEIGRAAAYCGEGPAYAGADTIIFRPGAELLPCFVGYAVNSECANSHKARMGQGSSVMHIGAQHLSRMRFRVPPLEHQRSVAEILATVDEAIEQTEALIAKTQHIKAGLMHDLFTRGVTPDGQLRPPREEAPQLYKESPLGWIPMEWTSGFAASYCTNIKVGVVNSATHAYVTEGIPFIRSQNVRPNRIVLEDLLFVTAVFNSLQKKSILSDGDVVIVRTGYPGTAAVVPAELAGANCFSLVIAQPQPGLLKSNYLAQYMNAQLCKRDIARLQFGSAQNNFNIGEMRKLRLRVPEIDEQDRILERLKAADDRISSLEQERSKNSALRTGLMQDLLTGRVPVTANAPRRLAEVAAIV